MFVLLFVFLSKTFSNVERSSHRKVATTYTKKYENIYRTDVPFFENFISFCRDFKYVRMSVLVEGMKEWQGKEKNV